MVNMRVVVNDKDYHRLLMAVSKNTQGANLRKTLREVGVQMLEFIAADFLQASKPGGSSRFPPLGKIGTAMRKQIRRRIGSFEDLAAARSQASPLMDTQGLFRTLIPNWNHKKGRLRKLGPKSVEVGSKYPGVLKHNRGGTMKIPGDLLKSRLKQNLSPAFYHIFVKSLGGEDKLKSIKLDVRRRPIIWKGQLGGKRTQDIVQTFLNGMFRNVRRRKFSRRSRFV
jgi:hypothetical protein